MVWLAPAIAATAALVQSIVRRRQEKSNIKDQTAANLQLSQDEFDKNKQMWELQNYYNSPAQQMSRLQGAGLNPNLVYGSNAPSGQSGSMSPYRGRETDVRLTPFQLPEVLGQYQEFSMRQAQIDNVNAQTENTKARTITEGFTQALKDILAKRGSQDFEQRGQKFPVEIAELIRKYNLGKELGPYQLEAAELKNKETLQKLQNLRQDEWIKMLVREQKSNEIGREGFIRQGLAVENEKKMREALFQRYKNEWMEQGVTTSDNLLIRVFARMLTDSGLVEQGGEWLKDFFKKKK